MDYATGTTSTVYVIDDDDAVRAAVLNLLRAEGLDTRGYATGAAFVAQARADAPSCLVCDIDMPAPDGLQLADELARLQQDIPIIFMTGIGTIALSVRAMKAGAVEFLTKPVDPELLLAAVREALALATASLAARRELAALRLCHASLSPREAETLRLVIGGLLNKQVAAELGVSEIMAKTHKRKVMAKMGARSLPDLVRAAGRLGIEKTRSR